ncbi:hypothetical protein ACSVH2_08580 [Flavobacterium sp. RSB2_4_14]|uniref:hypothetical protein n=1 Tax=Flavobacterium sp. RSB2_4_14 TaxID=3447665 RepID=UPI003F350C39
MNWLQKLIQKIKGLFSKSDKAVELLITENKTENAQPTEDNQVLEILNEIIIGSANDAIVLNRIPDFEFNENWSSLSSNKNANLFSQLAGTSAVAGSTMYATNGLYKATVSPEKLMVYNNGTTSSITLNGKSFSNHAGFVKAGAEVFTPILAFQFTSMLTGQYYMNGINNQLQAIQKGISQLLTFHQNERIAKIKSITNRLIELEQNKFYTLEDFVTIENMKMELATIRYEYLLAGQQQLQSALFPENKTENPVNQNQSVANIGTSEELKIKTQRILTELKTNFKSLVEDSGINSILDTVKGVFENSGAKVDELAKKVNESQFFYFVKAALEAEKLYQYSQLIALKANLSYKNPDENRIGKISQLYKSISNYHEQNESINSEVAIILKSLKSELTTIIGKHKENSKLNKTNIAEREKELHNQFENIETLTQNITELENERTKIKQAFEKPIDFIIDNRTGEGKIYAKN